VWLQPRWLKPWLNPLGFFKKIGKITEFELVVDQISNRYIWDSRSIWDRTYLRIWKAIISISLYPKILALSTSIG
jgi:hypothetical protein